MGHPVGAVLHVCEAVERYPIVRKRLPHPALWEKLCIPRI